METINIIAHTEDDSQIKAIKAVMKAFKIKYTLSKVKPYNEEFVKKIKAARSEKGERIIDPNNLWESIKSF